MYAKKILLECAEVGVHGGAVVPLVAALGAQALPEQGVPARGVDQVASLEVVGAVEDDIHALEQGLNVGGDQIVNFRFNFDLGVEGGDFARGLVFRERRRRREQITEKTCNSFERLDGGFAVNQWLIEQGLLVLNETPKEITPFSKLNVDWSKTKAWSEGGYYARVFFNVEGREPQGVIPSAEYAAFQDEMKAKFEAIVDDKGQPMNSLVFKPKEIYQNVRNVAPDLIVHFGGLYWRSIGSVGHSGLYLQENDTGPDGCNHAQYGMFLLAAPNCPLAGEHTGARLLDIAPTLLDLAGYDIPESMQGRSLVAGMEKKAPDQGFGDADSEQLIHDRLAGLGYI